MEFFTFSYIDYKGDEREIAINVGAIHSIEPMPGAEQTHSRLTVNTPIYEGVESTVAEYDVKMPFFQVLGILNDL